MSVKYHVHRATGRTLKRGAVPTPRAKLVSAKRFVQRAGVVPPPYFGAFPRKLSMWGNDSYGNCVSAEEALNKACSGVLISDDVLINWCEKNGVLNGADLLQVIQLMQQAGFPQDGNLYGDGQGLAVNWTDYPALSAAIYEAVSASPRGAIKLGIAADQLPAEAGNQMGWWLTENQADNNEDHCVATTWYGTAAQFATDISAAFGVNVTVPAGLEPTTPGVSIYTWDTFGFCTPAALVNMCGEAWIRQPSSTQSGTGAPTPDDVYLSGPNVPAQIAGAGQTPAWLLTLLQLGILGLEELLASLEPQGQRRARR